MGKSYFKQNLRYTQDVLVDENNLNVMMEWERPIMKQAAFDICKNGGDILNVGFGMGIIDSYIQEYPIKSHTIIEGHPDVQKKIIADGWAKKPNVILIFDQWQNVIDNLPKYDGIYFDTWAENQIPFDEKVPNILKPNGIYSFFNSPTNAGEEFVYPYTPLQKILKSPIPEYYYKGPASPERFYKFDITFSFVKVDPPKKNGYHHPSKKDYWSPLLTLKEEYK